MKPTPEFIVCALCAVKLNKRLEDLLEPNSQLRRVSSTQISFPLKRKGVRHRGSQRLQLSININDPTEMWFSLFFLKNVLHHHDSIPLVKIIKTILTVFIFGGRISRPAFIMRVTRFTRQNKF